MAQHAAPHPGKIDVFRHMYALFSTRPLLRRMPARPAS